MFPRTFSKLRTISRLNRWKRLSSNQIYFSILAMARVTWVSGQNDASFLDKNREYLFANSEQHVWNVCINWSYLIEISRLIAWKVGSFKASGDLLILNSFRFLRRHEFIICIFELRIFQKFYSKEHLKEIFGPMKEDWKFKNSFFGDEYNLIISVALFPISYESHNIFYDF